MRITNGGCSTIRRMFSSPIVVSSAVMPILDQILASLGRPTVGTSVTAPLTTKWFEQPDNITEGLRLGIAKWRLRLAAVLCHGTLIKDVFPKWEKRHGKGKALSILATRLRPFEIINRQLKHQENHRTRARNAAASSSS